VGSVSTSITFLCAAYGPPLLSGECRAHLSVITRSHARERGVIPDQPASRPQGPGNELDDEERVVGRVVLGAQPAGRRGDETEAGIESRMAEDDDHAMSVPPAFREAPAHEKRSEAEPLALRHDGDRAQPEPATTVAHGDPAEHDVADHGAVVVLGDQRDDVRTGVAQCVHQHGFVRAPEGALMHAPDRGSITRMLCTDSVGMSS
jgi:hypothetical protein